MSSTRRPTRTSSSPRSSPVAGRLARVRRGQEGHGRRAHRPQAPPERHGPPEGAGLDHRGDPQAVRQRALDPGHPGEGPRRDPGRGARGHLPQAAPGRAAHGRQRARRCSRTCSSTPSATTWPGSAATRSTRSSARPRARCSSSCKAHYKALAELDNPDKKAWSSPRSASSPTQHKDEQGQPAGPSTRRSSPTRTCSRRSCTS